MNAEFDRAAAEGMFADKVNDGRRSSKYIPNSSELPAAFNKLGRLVMAKMPELEVPFEGASNGVRQHHVEYHGKVSGDTRRGVNRPKFRQ